MPEFTCPVCSYVYIDKPDSPCPRSRKHNRVETTPYPTSRGYQLTWDDDLRPPIGHRFVVRRGGRNDIDTVNANRLVGVSGIVVAYQFGKGVWALFPGERGQVLVPWSQIS